MTPTGGEGDRFTDLVSVSRRRELGSGSVGTRGAHGGDGFGLIRHLLGLGLGKRGAEDLGLVVFETLDFGLHVS